jgi:hypothetical protein
MPFRRLLALAVIFLFCAPAPAKDKKKAVLPADILQAETALVIVDPEAGVDAADPNANRAARQAVEDALNRWGRFRLVQEGSTADLVIVVRKGNGKVVQTTIGGTPINGIPPVSVGSTTSPTQTTTRGGGRWGDPGANDPSSAGTQPASPRPQIEAGSSQDMFVVYRGKKDDPSSSPLEAPAVWRYSGKDVLASPSVPAVEAFHKLVVESEKQLATHP